MRTGEFFRFLVEWSGRSCALTMTIAWSSGPLTVTGILRPFGRERSLQGWTLVPPIEHGGSACFQPTTLHLDIMATRRVFALPETGEVRLRWWNSPDVMFELELLPDIFTAETATEFRAS
jgi:hypothetical protein